MSHYSLSTTATEPCSTRSSSPSQHQHLQPASVLRKVLFGSQLSSYSRKSQIVTNNSNLIISRFPIHLPEHPPKPMIILLPTADLLRYLLINFHHITHIVLGLQVDQISLISLCYYQAFLKRTLFLCLVPYNRISLAIFRH